MRFPSTIIIDTKNSLKKGPRALVWFSTIDDSKVVFVASSILEYLKTHVKKLESRWYMDMLRTVETYARLPTDCGAFGSITITNRVRITACAYYNHQLSKFSKLGSDLEDKFIFSYQITISVEGEEDFEECQLT